jgi:hypothetical protein
MGKSRLNNVDIIKFETEANYITDKIKNNYGFQVAGYLKKLNKPLKISTNKREKIKQFSLSLSLFLIDFITKPMLYKNSIAFNPIQFLAAYKSRQKRKTFCDFFSDIPHDLETFWIYFCLTLINDFYETISPRGIFDIKFFEKKDITYIEVTSLFYDLNIDFNFLSGKNLTKFIEKNYGSIKNILNGKLSLEKARYKKIKYKI